jgi:hypothetical protein
MGGSDSFWAETPPSNYVWTFWFSTSHCQTRLNPNLDTNFHFTLDMAQPPAQIKLAVSFFRRPDTPN